jgi:uncharacterized protein YlxW (UPF0749 family)
MEATITDAETTPTSKDYTSRPGALIWCFRKSRDRWKQKHQDLKATVKAYKNRVADLTKSREHWRLKAEDAAARLATLERQIAPQHTESTAPREKKTRPVSPR